MFSIRLPKRTSGRGRRWSGLPNTATWVVVTVLISFGASWATADPISTTSDLPTESTADQSKYPEIIEAQQKANARDFEGALEILKTAHQKYPELPPGEVLMAQLFYSAVGTAQTQQQRAVLLQSARNYLEQSVLAQPRDPEAYIFFGSAALQERQFTDADLLLSKAMTLAEAMPRDQPRKMGIVARCHAGLANVAENRADWGTAETHLKAWLASDEDNAQVRFRLGRALFNSKISSKREQAYEEFKKANSLDEQLAPAEVTVAQLFDQSGNEKVAAQWMDYAIKMAESKPAPYKVATRLGVANWHWGRNEIEKAKEHATQASLIDPAAINTKLTLGLIARYEKDMATAEKIFSDVYGDNPDNFTASNQLAVVLADQGDEAKLQRALGLADSNARAQQNNPTAAATLGWVYYRLGRYEEAERLLNAVASTGRLSPEVVFYLASVLAERDQQQAAVRLLNGSLDAKGPNIYRAEAQALLEKLEAAGASSSP